MPGSAMSAVESAHSACSNSTGRRGITKKYHVVSRNSNVDESLFGPRHKDIVKKQRQQNDVSRGLSAPMASKKYYKQSQEMVKIITKDLIRTLAVPREDPSDQSIILMPDEYLRILQSSRVFSKNEKCIFESRDKQSKEEQDNEVEERKRFMVSMDVNRKKHEKLNDLEEEAKLRAQYLLERANQLRVEQEDEIKDLNAMILNVKCHAIRDTQILEKDIISQEMVDEEQRLDAMMEEKRVKEIHMQESIEEQRKAERLEGARVLLEQITKREEDQILDVEQREQEARAMLKYLEKLEEEEYEDMVKKSVKQKETMEAIKEANMEAERRRSERKEIENLEDLKVLQYMKSKAERELAHEAQLQKVKQEKEKETAKLRALQERMQDVNAEKDALRAKRNVEENEREWRRKELLEAKKRSETEAWLTKARQDQVDVKERLMAMEAARDRQEFLRVLETQKKSIAQTKEKEAVVESRRKTHADEIRKQIREKEEMRIHARQQFFEDGVKVEEEARIRRAKLQEIKARKLQELKDSGLPVKYCAKVERQFANTQLSGVR